jgi:hypothetical protein
LCPDADGSLVAVFPIAPIWMLLLPSSILAPAETPMKILLPPAWIMSPAEEPIAVLVAAVIEGESFRSKSGVVRAGACCISTERHCAKSAIMLPWFAYKALAPTAVLLAGCVKPRCQPANRSFGGSRI